MPRLRCGQATAASAEPAGAGMPASRAAAAFGYSASAGCGREFGGRVSAMRRVIATAQAAAIPILRRAFGSCHRVAHPVIVPRLMCARSK